jgi:hypothetical protein
MLWARVWKGGFLYLLYFSCKRAFPSCLISVLPFTGEMLNFRHVELVKIVIEDRPRF